MRIVVVSVTSVVLLLLSSDIAFGCRCPALSEAASPRLSKKALAKDYKEAFAVFSGRVVEIDLLKVRFKVDRLWKGDFGDEIILSTGARARGDGTFDLPSSCDYQFQLGEKYLVFAYGDSRVGMKARKCTGTRLLKYAQRDVENLDEIRPHKQMNQGKK